MEEDAALLERMGEAEGQRYHSRLAATIVVPKDVHRCVHVTLRGIAAAADGR